jgi:hypothetical protein
MDATHSPNRPKLQGMHSLVSMHPDITFTPGDTFSWNPSQNSITYPTGVEVNDLFMCSLLHEIGHAKLLHTNFNSDLNLIEIERDAWEKAKQIAQESNTKIDDEHIEKCMDTYRDWLYARSLCPNCHQCGLQTAFTTYACIFCSHTWKVSRSRLCRVTRRIQK